MNQKRKALAMLLAVSMGSGVFTAVPAAAENEKINMLGGGNAKLTVRSSVGTSETDRTFDGDFYTSTSLSGYNGIGIFDENGERGNQYCALLEIQTTVPVPVDEVRVYAAPAVQTWMNQPTQAYPTGVDVYAKKDAKLQKLLSEESLEGKMLQTPAEREYWNGDNLYHTYYDFAFDETITTDRVVVAITNVEPWLDDITIKEVEFLAPEEAIPAEYKKIETAVGENAELLLSGEKGMAGYFLPGSEVRGKVSLQNDFAVNKVMLDGKELKTQDNTFSFTMPKEGAKLSVETALLEELDIPAEVVSKEWLGGELKSGGVPVLQYTFNTKINQLHMENVLINGTRQDDFVQRAFVDATDAKKAYVVLLKDRIKAGEQYTVSLTGVTGINGSALSGDLSETLYVPKSYTTGSGFSNAAFLCGYEDSTFRPENSITVNEALSMAKRLSPSADFSAVSESDEPISRLKLSQILYILQNGRSLDNLEDMFTALVSKEIIKGYPDGSFGREKTVRRSEAAALFVRVSGRKLENQETADVSKYSDIDENYWASKDIYLASKELKTVQSVDWDATPKNETYDVMNEKEHVWEQIPMVTAEQKEKGISGGEGGQWMQSIEVDSIDGTFLIGGVDVNGMICSTDGGKTWTRKNRGFVANGCVDTAIDPNNKNRILAIGSCVSSKPTHNGIYLSEDMSESWQQVLPHRMEAQRDTRDQLAWDPSSYDEEIGGSRIAYWSTLWRVTDGINMAAPSHKSDEVGGLYKSEDGGKTWFLVNEEMSDGYIKVHPEKGYVYVANDKGFHISKDGGKTFTTKLRGEPIMSLDVVKTRPDNVYVNDSKGVMISENCGETFTRIPSESFPVKTNLTDVRNITMGLAVSPVNPDKMLVDRRDWLNYRNDRFYSHDGGKTWTQCAYDTSKDFFFAHNRQHPFAWHPTDENKVWSLGGDWIVSSDDAGKTFIWDAEGYCGIPPASRANFNPYSPDIFYAGAQDLDGIISYDGGETWKPLEAAGKYWNAYGSYAVDEKLLFAGLSDGWYNPRYLCVSKDGGESWTDTGLYLKNGTARAATSFWQSAGDSDALFAGEYYSRDRAETWQEMKGCQMVLAINYYHNKELYGSAGNGIIVVSYDNGDTWLPLMRCRIDNETAMSSVTTVWGSGITIWDLEYDGINDILYYAAGPWYSATTLVRVEDNEQKNLTRNLVKSEKRGNASWQLIALDPKHPDILYAAGYNGDGLSTAGAWRSCDRGETFQNLTSMGDSTSIVKTGPSAAVGPQQIVVNPKDGYLWCWDGGQGWWKIAPPYEVR